MPGQLFTNYFLEEGILHTHAWQESLSQPTDFDTFRTHAQTLIDNAASFHNFNEAATEQELIRPLFELLGWAEYLPQQGSDHNEDIPDHLLFGDAESKDRAAAKPAPQRYPDALAVAESKRLNRPLDVRGKTGSPHGQILRYLATADIASDGRIRWGILTNGRIWRLYDRRALPRASGYYEVDLNAALQAADDFHAIRTFRLLFGRPAFSPQHGAQTSFLEDAIAEGRRYEEQVARDLVRDHVLRLTYTAHDMAPFARDLGYDGPPFIWNEEKRRHLRARLDALYFHLYGLSKNDAAYILDTFPIVRRHDKAAFGAYRTKEMVLAYYNALAAGDTETDVAL